MVSRCLLKSLVLLAVIAFVFVPALVGQNMRVGENNEITFETSVKVGQTVLPPGTHRFEHVVESDHHIIKLTPTSMSKDSHEVNVQCKLESVGKPAKYTELHFAPGKKFKTLDSVLVAGENERHRF